MSNPPALAKKPKLLVSALAAAVLAPSFAHAALEEVVVTARKQDESALDIPIAVSTFSANDIKALNVTQTTDIGAFTPSVHIEIPSGTNGTVSRVTMRGQVQFDNIITLDSSVGWYLNDVYLARAQNTNTSMFDIERVEVVKGPQGTLYGRNTTGGTIKLVTTKAEQSAGLEGFVTGGLGNYEQSKIGGAVNIPIIPNVLAVRLTALKDKVDDGFQKVDLYNGDPTKGALGTFLGQRENGTMDSELYRLGVTYEPLDSLRVLLNYEEVEADVSMASTNTAGFTGPIASPLALGSFYHAPSSDFMHVALNNQNIAYAKSKTASATIEYDINDTLATKLVYGWRTIDSWYDTDIDGTSAAISYFVKPFTNTSEQNSVEWQLTGTAMDGGLDWVSGLYYFEERGQDTSYSGGVGNYRTGTLYNYSVIRADKNRSASAFFQGTLHLTDKLNFTGGLRYTKDSKPVYAIAKPVNFVPTTNCRFNTANSGVPNQNAADCSWANKDSYEYVSWTAGFDYRLTADVMAYLKASSASRAGGQNGRGLTEATTQPFQPEKATDIELGTKGQFFQHTLQVTADYFHTFYTDIQQTDILPDGSGGLVTFSSNKARANIDGIEVEAKWQVIDALTLSGTVGLLNWKFDDENSILSGTPEKQYTVRADYNLPTGIGTWLFDVNYSWRDQVLGNCAGDPGLSVSARDCVRDFKPETGDAVGLLGARVSLDVGSTGLNVALWGRNLTDEQYVQPGVQLYFPSQGLALTNDTVGTPRTFGVEATYKF